MIEEKIRQAAGILDEKDIDLWLVFLRESSVNRDPCQDLILGTDVTWQSAFCIARTGETVAIVGNFDESHIRSVTPYAEVRSYVTGIRDELVAVLDRFRPERIGINYSTDDVMADGLPHGLWLVLNRHLEGTGYESRLVSAAPVLSSLRGRKSPTEKRWIAEAVQATEEIFDEVTGFLRVGRTEKEIAAFAQERARQRGLPFAWTPDMCPSVFSGPDTAGAHAGPTDRAVQPGHLVNLDFGVKVQGYCSDLQRTWYAPREGESEAPGEVARAFEAVRDAIRLSAKHLVPGATGLELDEVARDHITSQGFDGYPHALGHQVGRHAHDGGGILGPLWSRYGDLPRIPLEADEVYTLEPRVEVPGHGVATLEEIAVVTSEGGEFVSNPQQEVWIIEEDGRG